MNERLGATIAVTLTPDALRRVRGGHPWVFDRSVVRAPATAATGDLAVVFDARQRFAAIGLYDATSPIRIRILHHGKPTTVDTDFLRARMAGAVERRSEFTSDRRTTAYRLVHGENDALPGLVVDRYDTSVVISLDTAAWLPHLDRVVAVAADLLEPERIVLRTSRTVANAATTPPFPSAAVGVPADAGHAGRVVWGDPLDDEIVFLEHGVRFGVDLLDGQKTGHFLDQRDNRRLVASHSRGRDVLDVFCCTGGFGVHAAVGGARSVLSVDQSKSAIAAAIANMERNRGRRGVDSCEHDTACGDAFEVLARLRASGRRFDVIVVDPPAFARRQREVDSALAAYRRLTRAALDVAAPDVRLFQASCSSRVDRRSFLTAIDQAVHESGWTMLDRTVTGAPADHPVGFADGSYLDATFLRLRRNDQSPGRTARRSRAR